MNSFGTILKKNETKQKITKQETKIFAEIEISYKRHTNILKCDIEEFSLMSIESAIVIEPIDNFENCDIRAISGFFDPLSQQLLRFPNENKHTIIFFICEKDLINDKTEYIMNKRKKEYYILEYGGNKCNLMYVDERGEKINVQSIRYKAKKIVIYSHQCLVGCCNDVPLFYFKNKGKIKINFEVKNEI